MPFVYNLWALTIAPLAAEWIQADNSTSLFISLLNIAASLLSHTYQTPTGPSPPLMFVTGFPRGNNATSNVSRYVQAVTKAQWDHTLETNGGYDSKSDFDWAPVVSLISELYNSTGEHRRLSLLSFTAGMSCRNAVIVVQSCRIEPISGYRLSSMRK